MHHHKEYISPIETSLALSLLRERIVTTGTDDSSFFALSESSTSTSTSSAVAVTAAVTALLSLLLRGRFFVGGLFKFLTGPRFMLFE
jgi:hypothetical protein